MARYDSDYLIETEPEGEDWDGCVAVSGFAGPNFDDSHDPIQEIMQDFPWIHHDDGYAAIEADAEEIVEWIETRGYAYELADR